MSTASDESVIRKRGNQIVCCSVGAARDRRSAGRPSIDGEERRRRAQNNNGPLVSRDAGGGGGEPLLELNVSAARSSASGAWN